MKAEASSEILVTSKRKLLEPELFTTESTENAEAAAPKSRCFVGGPSGPNKKASQLKQLLQGQSKRI
jgi:hypothetical protein